MAQITTSTSKFPAELVTDVFNKVKGHSALAKLSRQVPIPFAGTDQFVFTMDGEASIVGEGMQKPAGEADFTPVTIKPIKFIYQHRLTDEFIHMAEEKQISYLDAFTTGFATKMARALDIAAFHGVNPADNTASALIGSNNFDSAVPEGNVVTYDASALDEAISDAVGMIQDKDGEVTGIAFSPKAAAALGKIKASGLGTFLYPEFRFGNNPGTFGGVMSDNNNTVSFSNHADRVVLGDFANAFRWGYAEDIPLEIIQYGDPDGQGDLKRLNQIVLRSETYLGWGILDKNSFAIIRAQENNG